MVGAIVLAIGTFGMLAWYVALRRRQIRRREAAPLVGKLALFAQEHALTNLGSTSVIPDATNNAALPRMDELLEGSWKGFPVRVGHSGSEDAGTVTCACSMGRPLEDTNGTPAAGRLATEHPDWLLQTEQQWLTITAPSAPLATIAVMLDALIATALTL